MVTPEAIEEAGRVLAQAAQSATRVEKLLKAGESIDDALDRPAALETVTALRGWAELAIEAAGGGQRNPP